MITNYPATIVSGTSLSVATGMGQDSLVGISMPEAWVPAPLTFQVSPDGGTSWRELVDDAGNAVTVPPSAAAAGQFIVLQSVPFYLWRGINMLKVRSGTASTPVVQSDGAVVTLVGRPGVS